MDIMTTNPLIQNSVLCWEWFLAPGTPVSHTTSRSCLLPALQIQSLSPKNQENKYNTWAKCGHIRHSGITYLLVASSSPECSRGGQWEGSQVSDLCIWDLVNGGTQMSALSGRHKTVHGVHWRGGGGKCVHSCNQSQKRINVYNKTRVDWIVNQCVFDL